MKQLQILINGQWVQSETERYTPVYNPSTGEILAQAPCCTKDEVNGAVASASAAFPSWAATPVTKRVQILYRVKQLIDERMEELTDCVAREHGKVWSEAEGDVLKAREGTELACSMPALLSGMGESLLDASKGFDTVLYREPVGVFACIVPFNFPAMIPMGWMTPVCIASGNTVVIKAASMTPMTVLKFAEIYKQAGLPDGVINIVTCSRNEAELLLSHPQVRGISFVGSTRVGLHIYQTAAQHGKRVQALCEAKNHALVMEDAPIARTAAGILNAAFGCAGERCMALPVICVQESIADALVDALAAACKSLRVGPAYAKTSEMGPLVTAAHRQSVVDWIETGVKEGATLALDGRDLVIPGYEQGFYLGPTIFDHVTPDMKIGQREIFGPVLCIKRVKDFEDGLSQMNANPFANGSVIFTQSGYYAREFMRRTDGGMVGVNVGIPVPVGVFPFSGHKQSFFGDLHTLGRDGVRFYTQTKTVTTRWFDESEQKQTRTSTWDGMI